MAFGTLIAQGLRNRRKTHPSKDTSGQTPKKQLQKHKSPLARSLRNCRLANNSEGRHQPSKASSLTRAGDGETVTFPPRRMAVSCAVCAMCLFVFFIFLLSSKFRCISSSYERRGKISIKDRSDWNVRTRWMRSFLRQSWTWSSRFASTRGILCTTLPTVRLL